MGKLIKTGIPGLQFDGNKLVIDKVVEGVRICKTLQTTDLIIAQKILAKEVNAVLEGKYLPSAKARSLTVLDILIDFWENNLKHKEYAKDTRYILDSVADRLGDIKIVELSRNDIERYKRERKTDKKRNRCSGTISQRTIQKELQHLSMALNLSVDNNVIPSNPIRRFISVPLGMPKKSFLMMVMKMEENGRQFIKL